MHHLPRVRIAYVVLSHRNPDQVLRLVGALREGPAAEVLVRHETVAVVATLTTGAQRARIWATALTLYPGWSVYEDRAAPREIGVFLLTPASG